MESGIVLPSIHLAYTTLGQMNAAKDNVVWIFHALTANDDPADWWHGLVGEGCLFTPEKYFLICVNMPGSCYGSIGPTEINPENGLPYYHDFPWFTIKDMVKAYQLLQAYLGIERIKIGLGGSMGGQQLLEWAASEPNMFDYIIPIATNAKHSAWGIAFNTSQRMCIELDASWQEQHELAGINGLKVARSIALLSYRNHDTYHIKQQGVTTATASESIQHQVFKATTYQQYQGEKLAKRFNAFSYYALTKAMDSHDIGRGRQSVEAALAGITARTLTIGISSDLLFPVQEQAFLAKHIPNAQHVSIESLYGHDGFLLEFAQIERVIASFLSKEAR